jgi:UDP-N-acetylmuramyl pentapeptide phosphotransferase/UDP-N-acetylglucosamine-1-phosphate transferase
MSSYELVFDHVLIYSSISSATLSGIVVLSKRWHGRLTFDTAVGAQKFHTAPTPRIGGIALFGSLVVAWLLAGNATGGLLGLMLITGLPAFIAGTIEDFTKKLGVRERLVATIFSGFLASLFTGYRLDSIDVPFIDPILAFSPFAIAFTAFAVGGVANAVNIIDGFNGLAGVVLMICFGMMGLIAFQVGDIQLVNLCLISTVCVFGFMLLNFPFGKIFMGDGGAYFMGFMLAWTAVMLPMRNPSVSPWATVIVCSYPIIETLFSIWRKAHRKGSNPGQPDRVHFHMLVYQRMSRAMFFGRGSSLINGLTTLFILPFALMCSFSGVAFYSSTPMLVAALVCNFAVYYLIYLRLTQFRWCLRPVCLRTPSGNWRFEPHFQVLMNQLVNGLY